MVEARARARGRVATLDALTGLPGKDAIVERLAGEAERCARAGQPLSIALVDARRLRSLNEERGRAAGDAALRSIAVRLRAALRENDGVGRYGGGEFLLTLPGCDEAGAARCAARLQAFVEAESSGACVRVCIGCATSPAGDGDLGLLVAAADVALRRVKRSAAGGWAVATADDWAASRP